MYLYEMYRLKDQRIIISKRKREREVIYSLISTRVLAIKGYDEICILQSGGAVVFFPFYGQRGSLYINSSGVLFGVLLFGCGGSSIYCLFLYGPQCLGLA